MHIAAGWAGLTCRRAYPDLNQGPADLQSAALTTELYTHADRVEMLPTELYTQAYLATQAVTLERKTAGRPPTHLSLTIWFYEEGCCTSPPHGQA